MKTSLRFFVLLALLAPCFGQMRLPESRVVAGPLDSIVSNFGDEFFNFPSIFGGRAAPGETRLSGWIRIEFDEPSGGYARFRLTLESVGSPDAIAFPGGQTYTLDDNKAATNPIFVSGGRVELQSGTVDDFALHAIFQNSVIARVTKNIRIPFAFINDYPPTALPIALPFEEEPRVFDDARFTFASDGTITGFEFHGETIAPVTLFPRLGIFPPYSFGENGTFYFANPTGCLPDAPPENCLNDENNPNGVALDRNAFFHPHLDLVTNELRAMPSADPILNCAPAPTVEAGGLVAVGDRLYLLDGVEDRRTAGAVQVLDSETGIWTAAPSVPTPVTSGASVALGDQIYLLGGTEGPQDIITNRLQVFDTVTSQWSQLSPAPSSIRSAAAAAVGQKLFFIGGLEEAAGGFERLTGKVQIYERATDTWSLGSDAPVPVADTAFAVVQDRIYLINGRIEGDIVTNEVWIYITSEDRWETGPRTVQGVVGAVAGTIAGRVYLAGGRRSVDGPTERLLQVLVLESNTWRKGLEPPAPVADAAATALNGRFYVAGGRVQVGLDTAPGSATDVVQVYDPADGWSICSSRPIVLSTDVVNAACGMAGPVDLSPGTRAVAMGHNFAENTITAPRIRWNGTAYTTDLPLQLNGITVSVDGKPAPLISVGPELIEFQVPYSVEASSQLRRMVKFEVSRQNDNGEQTTTVRVPLLAAAPSLYVFAYGEYRDPVYLNEASAQARNADGTLNHPARPISPGEHVTFRATGVGLVSPLPANGQRAGESNLPLFSPELQIGGVAAEIISVKLAPYEVGIYLIEAIVPEEVAPSNNVRVRMTVNGVASNVARLSVQ